MNYFSNGYLFFFQSVTRLFTKIKLQQWPAHLSFDSPLQFVLGSHSILRTHRVHGATNEWSYRSVFQWYHGSGVIVPSPRPLQLICQRCHLSIRRVTYETPLCFWCGTLHDLAWVMIPLKNVSFFPSDCHFVVRATYLPSLFQALATC